MKPKKRKQDILKRLRAMHKELTVKELSEAFSVSPLTIRRDLAQLEEEGALLRTHGGCAAFDRAAFESAYHSRVLEDFELKRAIGMEASNEVSSGETILISDGSTTFHLAASLNGISRLTVYTNSVAMIDELSRNRGVELVVLGGAYNREMHYLNGSITEQTIEHLVFDCVFIGSDAISASGDCLATHPSNARITQIMMKAGKKKVLLADHTKVNGDGHVAYGTLRDFDLWITTPGIPKKLLRKFRKETMVKEASAS